MSRRNVWDLAIELIDKYEGGYYTVVTALLEMKLPSKIAFERLKKAEELLKVWDAGKVIKDIVKE